MTHNKVEQEVLNHIETVIKEVEKEGNKPQIIESLKNLQSKQEEKMSIQFIKLERVAKKEVNYYCNRNPDVPAIFVSSKYGTIRFNTSAVKLLKLEPESLIEFNILKENTAQEKRHYSVNKTSLSDGIPLCRDGKMKKCLLVRCKKLSKQILEDLGYTHHNQKFYIKEIESFEGGSEQVLHKTYLLEQ